MSDPYADSLINEIESIQRELNSIALRRKKLTAQQKLAKSRLGGYLLKTRRESYRNYKADKLIPKPKPEGVRKKKAEKIKQGIEYFESIGHQNPKKAYYEFVKLTTGKDITPKKKEK